MIAAYWGKTWDMPELRRRFPISMQGASINDLIRVANGLGLASRAVRMELGGLKKISLPAVLHWEFNHFVVLKKVEKDGIVIHDPASGQRRLSVEEISRAFTGVALELRPSQEFKPEKRETAISLWRFFSQVKGLGLPLVQILTLTALVQAAAMVIPFFAQLAIDHVVPAGDLKLLKVLALGFGLIYLLRPTIDWLRTRLTVYVATQFSAQLTSNLFKYLLSLPLPYFEKRSIGDLLTRFEASDRLRELLTQGFIAVFLDMVLGLLTLAMMFYYQSMMGVVVLVTAVIVIALRLSFIPKLRRLVNEMLHKQGREQGEMIETLRGIPSVKFAQKEIEREAIWNNSYSQFISTAADLETAQADFSFVRSVIEAASMVLLIYLGIRYVIDNDNAFTLGAFFAFAAYRDMFFERLGSLIDQLVELSMARVHLERLSEIISTEPEPEPSEYFGYGTEALRISLSDVDFSFSAEAKTIIREANLQVRDGEWIMITGPSGTGKTTLMKLVGGVYSPVSGTVRLNGVDVAGAGLRYLRNHVASVLQSDYLFRGSIIDNLTFFDRVPNFDQAMECARLAGVHDEIMQMPMSYETLIGEMGSSLSQGQQQRLLLARALYQQKPVLLLDEATAHLDAEKEREVLTNLRGLDLTVIMIAHKTSLLKYADRHWQIDDEGNVVSRRRKDAPVRKAAE